MSAISSSGTAGQTLREDDPNRLFRGRSLAMSAALIVIAIIALIPLWAIFAGTFQDGIRLMREGLNLSIDFEQAGFYNYRLLFSAESGNYFRWFGNSLMVTGIQTVLTLFISAFVAYGFAKYEFRFKSSLFVLVIVLMTVPLEMMMLPLFQQTNAMGLQNTHVALFLPFLASAITIFFFRQYLAGIPTEIIEAGRVDGVSEFGIFFRLVLPLMKPAMAAMAILNGMMAWNAFLWPLLVLRSNELFTLPIGLSSLLSPYGNNYNLLIIGAFFSLFPILILFLLFQRFFISGMTAGAVKG
ncbi:carbohydrate ABC transporter permease [Xylanimonas allomyrinae]|uniref:Carbohydrate ABC transporter permease n=1 Tax=Xylanimonas allomyrinae TaxID=2509459 RepID=A0A4V0YEH3_9MICO|nr:carbohydrate ABC transporter permease [Xylanimonas allomyrinae]QAY64211.1 carbohydrate ABC transporter permease [Xylanimonas allomyrinae]